MDLCLLNTSFETVAMIDSYISAIWTDRYYGYGDFEIYMPASPEAIQLFKQNYYLCQSGSEHLMIVEDIELTTDVEQGDKIKVTGRSLESILDRRIIWGQAFYNGNLQDAIKDILNNALISPSDSNRKIPNFIFQESTDSYITGLTLTAQYFGDNVYDTIKAICENHHIGFKVVLNDENQFVFTLYRGTNRSYSQSDNQYIVFSPNYDNLLNSDSISSLKKMKNVTLIGGKGDGYGKKTAEYGVASGLYRRETYTNASSVSDTYTDESGTKQSFSDSDYESQLKQKGKENLDKNTEITSFDGEVSTDIQYSFGKDYLLGDVVQNENAYGQNGETRITEIIYSQSTSGESVYPTFETDNETTADEYTTVNFEYDSVSGILITFETVESPVLQWKSVCKENESFTAPWRSLYRYGDSKTSAYIYKIFEAGDYVAANDVMGKDPASGVDKKLWIANISGKDAKVI